MIINLGFKIENLRHQPQFTQGALYLTQVRIHVGTSSDVHLNRSLAVLQSVGCARQLWSQ